MNQPAEYVTAFQPDCTPNLRRVATKLGRVQIETLVGPSANLVSDVIPQHPL